MNIEKLTEISPTQLGYIIDANLPVISMDITIEGAHHISLHSHPRGQLLYARKGIVRIVSTQGAWLVPTDQAVWVPPNIKHEVIAIDSVNILTLFIDPSAINDLPINCSVVHMSSLLKSLLESAIEIGNAYSAKGAEQRLMQVIIDQMKNLKQTNLHLPITQEKRLKRVIDHLISEPSDNRSLEELSVISNTSARTLARLFHQETNMTFGQWRRQLRLLEAIERLEQGQSVTRIAFELGYQSPSAFVAMFRRNLGKPPSNFSKK
ncbi:MAG: helix-turn-helix transcriptional regulator [Gammaproteobacteria bacterium]|nr:helix-turn-helix transcriptional regulator [Gammaproteobacteria bacterium]